MLAETDRALALFESRLPARWYIPREDVSASLEPTRHRHALPVQGRGRLLLGRPGSREDGKDVVWYYEDPLPEVGRITGLLCFFNEQVDIELDGELQELPGVGLEPAASSPSRWRPRASARGRPGSV